MGPALVLEPLRHAASATQGQRPDHLWRPTEGSALQSVHQATHVSQAHREARDLLPEEQPLTRHRPPEEELP